MARWTTQDIISILHEHLHNYATDKKGRKMTIGQAKQAILALAAEQKIEPPLDLEKASKIENWFHNNCPKAKKDTQQQPHIGDKRSADVWTLRRVVKRLMLKEIEAVIREKYPDAQSGDETYLSNFNSSWSKVVNSLTPEKQKEYQLLAHEWNTSGVTEEMKAEAADKRFAERAHDFMHDMKAKMGVQIFMLAGYKSGNGDLVKAKLETKHVGAGAEKFLPIFGRVGEKVWENWDQYLHNVLDEPENVEDDVPRKISTDKSVPWTLDSDEDKWPLLPHSDNFSLSQVKDIVRSFLTLTYRRMTENSKLSVPWSAIARDPAKYLDPQYLPPHVVISEVSKMQSGPLHQCLQFWIKRQESGNIPFRFKSVLASDVRHTSHKRKRDDTEDSGERADEGKADKSLDMTSKDNSLHMEKIISHKDSPAHISSTLADRLSFLASLADMPPYQKVLSLVERLPVNSTTPILTQPPPSWASWNYPNKHLPQDFHEGPDQFEAFMAWLKTKPYASPFHDPYPQDQVLLVCLGIGLVLRDLATIQLAEEDGISPDDCGDFLQNSLLSWPHAEALLKTCRDIEMVLKSCSGQVHGSSPPPHRDVQQNIKGQSASSPQNMKKKGKQPLEKKDRRCKNTVPVVKITSPNPNHQSAAEDHDNVAPPAKRRSTRSRK